MLEYEATRQFNNENTANLPNSTKNLQTLFRIISKISQGILKQLYTKTPNQTD